MPGWETTHNLYQRIGDLEREMRLMHERLQKTEHRFEMMADAVPAMVWTSGTDSHCTWVSRRWLEFRGRTLEQEMGDGWMEGVHPDDLRLCMDTYLGSFQERRCFKMEYRVRRADGQYCWLVDSGAPWYEQDGMFAGFVGFVAETSDGKQESRAIGLETTETGRLPLTTRQREVLRLIAEGHSTRKIAQLLGISYKTADSHRTKIMEKLDVHETASLVRYAVRMGLIQA